MSTWYGSRPTCASIGTRSRWRPRSTARRYDPRGSIRCRRCSGAAGSRRKSVPEDQNRRSTTTTTVTTESPWKTAPGLYTREGDVRSLLSSSDDMFVVAKPGDEIAVSFDASTLRPLPSGWTRTFLLKGDGFSKEMDVNSASPDRVEPLPFHGMSVTPTVHQSEYPESPHTESIARSTTHVVSLPSSLAASRIGNLQPEISAVAWALARPTVARRGQSRRSPPAGGTRRPAAAGCQAPGRLRKMRSLRGKRPRA